jgi:hypothetical protein
MSGAMIIIISAVMAIISLLGLLLILFRKIPVLVELPEITADSYIKKLMVNFKNRIKNLSIFKTFSLEIFLQKIISKFRVLTLKTERKTYNWLQKLRERAKRKRMINDNYWQDLKSKTDPEKEKENLSFAHFFKKKRSNSYLFQTGEKERFSKNHSKKIKLKKIK